MKSSNPFAVLDDEALRHLVSHLLAGRRDESLRLLLSTETQEGRNAWYEAKLDRGMRDSFEEDVRAAMAGSHGPPTPALQLRYALMLSSARDALRRIPPDFATLMVRLGRWSPGRALAWARAAPSRPLRAEALARLAELFTGEAQEGVAREALGLAVEGGAIVSGWTVGRLAALRLPGWGEELWARTREQTAPRLRIGVMGALFPHMDDDIKELIASAVERDIASISADSTTLRSIYTEMLLTKRQFSSANDAFRDFAATRAALVVKPIDGRPPSALLAKVVEWVTEVEHAGVQFQTAATVLPLLPATESSRLTLALTARALGADGHLETFLEQLGAFAPASHADELLAAARAIPDPARRRVGLAGLLAAAWLPDADAVAAEVIGELESEPLAPLPSYAVGLIASRATGQAAHRVAALIRRLEYPRHRLTALVSLSAANPGEFEDALVAATLELLSAFPGDADFELHWSAKRSALAEDGIHSMAPAWPTLDPPSESIPEQALAVLVSNQSDPGVKAALDSLQLVNDRGPRVRAKAAIACSATGGDMAWRRWVEPDLPALSVDQRAAVLALRARLKEHREGEALRELLSLLRQSDLPVATEIFLDVADSLPPNIRNGVAAHFIRLHSGGSTPSGWDLSRVALLSTKLDPAAGAEQRDRLLDAADTIEDVAERAIVFGWVFGTLSKNQRSKLVIQALAALRAVKGLSAIGSIMAMLGGLALPMRDLVIGHWSANAGECDVCERNLRGVYACFLRTLPLDQAIRDVLGLDVPTDRAAGLRRVVALRLSRKRHALAGWHAATQALSQKSRNEFFSAVPLIAPAVLRHTEDEAAAMLDAIDDVVRWWP